MSLLFHQFKKDGRSLRLVLALWGVLVAAQALLVGAAGLVATNWVVQITVRMLLLLLPLLQGLLVLIIVPLLVHQEPLVGTTAAWLTRPISRPLLLASKAFFVLVVLVAPPLAAEVALLAASGVSPSDIALAAAEIVLTQSALAAGAGALASVTPTFVRYVVWGAALYGANALAGIVLVFARLQGDTSQIWSMADPEQFRAHRILALALMLSVGAAVVLHQYLTRGTRRSVGLLVGGAVLLLVVPELWRPGVSATPGAPASDPAGAPIEVHVDTSAVSAHDEFTLRATPKRRKTVLAMSECRGLPSPGGFCTLEKLQGQLRYPDGASVPVQREARPSFFSASKSTLEGVLDATVVNHVLGTSHPWDLFEVDSSTYADRGAVPARLEGQVTVALKNYRLAAELPLRPGASHRTGSEQIVIADVLRGSHSCSVVLREQRLNLLFAHRPPASGLPLALLGDRPFYALLNREKRQAFMTGWDAFPDISAALGSSQRLSHEAVTLNFTSESRFENLPELDAAWLDGAVLVRVETVHRGRVSLPITVPNLVMEEKRNAGSTPTVQPGLTASEYYARGAARLEDALDRPWPGQEMAEARAYLHKAIEAEPQMARAHAALALLAAVGEGEPPKRRAGAKAWLERMGAAGARDPAAQRVEAFLVDREGGNPVAVLEQSLKTSPDLASTWRDLGYFYGRQYRLRKALEAFDKALALAPAPTEAALIHVRRGDAYAYSRRPVEALVAYGKAIQLRPGHARSWGQLCEMRLLGRDCEGARKAATHALGLQNDDTWRSCLLQADICLGEIKEDGPVVRAASADDLVRIGDFFRDKGNGAKAAAYYARVEPASATPALQVSLSELALRRGDTRQAWSELETALARRSEDPAVLAQAAAVRTQAGEKDRALALAAQALEAGLDAKALARLDRAFGKSPEYQAMKEKVLGRTEGLLTFYEHKYDYQHLRRDHAMVQWAIWHLGATHKDPEVVPYLLRCLAESAFEDTRAKAADALWLIGDKRALAPLIAALADPSLKVEGFAASGLGDLGDPAAIDPLLDLFGRLPDNREETKARVADALGKLGDRRAIVPIRASLEKIDDPRYTGWAKGALTRLEQLPSR